jgi:hypothetical protein
VPGYATMAEVGLDGPWITPYHLASASADGPVLLTYNYLDAPSARLHADLLRRDGFLATMPFNRVLTAALALVGLTRSDLYVTHAFHLLPQSRSAAVPARDIDQSFDAVGRHELKGRRVIALGEVAAWACRRYAIPHLPTAHPSARGTSFSDRAQVLAKALQAITSPSA